MGKDIFKDLGVDWKWSINFHVTSVSLFITCTLLTLKFKVRGRRNSSSQRMNVCHFTISFCWTHVIFNRVDDNVLYSSHIFPDDKLRVIQPNNFHSYYSYFIISKSNNYRSTILKTCRSSSQISRFPMNIEQCPRLRRELILIQML